ncbi:MAG TPA: bifunctional UDP-N-acetylglucosamine diphosphorylase/glucosamine-1-phosphate N-acetyltransferase GlmU [Acidobacteriota bacterium]|nr:bifunctional UDP-N-acetylglucosamine diphosphorylase/glucosamine-1-phosphate N-acetyltransferase GlmU [Acidobacteriota bacterium]
MSSGKESRYALILAAGKGTRFRSDLPKVLHRLCGRPMIEYLLETLSATGIDRIFVVVGPGDDPVRQALQGRHLDFVVQERQLGTGHAVQCAVAALSGLEGSLLVLYGDTPFVEPQALERLIQEREELDADQTLLTIELEDPTGYGRIIRDQSGRVVEVIEEKEASPVQKRIREIHAGFNCFKIPALREAVFEIRNENQAGEYYLTDLPKIFAARGGRVEAVLHEPSMSLLGINDRVQLSEADRILRRRIRDAWMSKGVTMINADTILIDSTVEIGADSVLYPGAILEGRTSIASACTIGPGCHLVDAIIEAGARLDGYCIVRDSRIGAGSFVGPFAHLRQNAAVGERCRVGNFVEVKQSSLGDETKAAHLSYLGDARIGSEVNIGAGTITCNYDGLRKHQTQIGDGAFVGSGSQLVAPVRIGRDAYVAAGSTITEDVPDGALGLARQRQIVKPGWAAERRRKCQDEK